MENEGNKILAIRLDKETTEIVKQLKEEGYSISGYIKLLLKKDFKSRKI